MTLPTTDDATLRTRDTAEQMWDLAEEDPAEARRAYPSGWLWLTGEEAVRSLLAALLDADTDARYGVEDLASRSGLGESAVETAIEALISVGVLVADEGAYRINDCAIVYHAATELSAAVEATGAPDDESGFEYLARLESVRLMLDALLDVDPDQSLEQEDIHRLSGVSRKRVWHHVEKLVALGVVEESGDEYVVGGATPVVRWVQSLDAAVVGATLAPSHP